MNIERIRVLKTVKAGDKIYGEGMIFTKPIPRELITEVREGADTVEVLGSEIEEDHLNQAVEVRKAQLEAESVKALADLEIKHNEEVERLRAKIERLEEEAIDLELRAETAEKKVADIEKKAKK